MENCNICAAIFMPQRSIPNPHLFVTSLQKRHRYPNKLFQQGFPWLVGCCCARARAYFQFFLFEQRALMLPCNLLCQLSHSRLHKLVLIEAMEKKTAIRAHASAKKAPFFQTQLCIMQLKKH